MIVRINRFVCKVSDFLIVFHLPDFNQEVAYEGNDIFNADEHEIVRISN